VRPIALGTTCAALFWAAGCTPLLPGGRSVDTSTALQPPSSWAGVLTLVFYDSTTRDYAHYRMTVDFFDGRKWRTVHPVDVRPRTIEDRTPWYRLFLARNEVAEIPIRITVDHDGGYRTVAEYPLAVETTAAYYVRAFLDTRTPDPLRPVPPSAGYPLHPHAPVAPSDSLWVIVSARDRLCFRCPF
jgi:hypothetical protein